MNKKILTILVLVFAPLLNLLAQTDSAGAGYSLKCTGPNRSYVDIGDNLNTLNFPFTIEAWINLSGYPNVEGSIFASDNTDIYSGFWFNVNKAGNLFIEFGDNVGSGQGDRRGFQTATILPLHQWIYVAAVCHSMTDIQLYFNGINQPREPTNGTSGATTVYHNSGNGQIGNWISISRETPFLGQIDELRIWNAARTINQILRNMCSRVAPDSDLAGYWRGSGSLKGKTVKDFALVPHDGTIAGAGAVRKVISGAPVGDYSIVRSAFANRVLRLVDPSGDTFKVTQITGNPYFVFAYGVDQAPYRAGALNSFPNHYFGVFCAENKAPAGYRIIYIYSNASLNGNDEINARVFSKTTDSSSIWDKTGIKPDTIHNSITKQRLSTRGEYILNFLPSKSMLLKSVAAPNETLLAYPNPAHNNMLLSFSNIGEPVNVVRIVDLTGKVIREIRNPANNLSLNLDISNWNSGIYFAEAMTQKGNYFTRFLVQ